MKIELGKVYRARNGSLWRVVHIHPDSGLPVVAAPEAPNADGDYDEPNTYTLDGRFWKDGKESPNDLIAEHREPMKLPMWVVKSEFGVIHARDNEIDARNVQTVNGGTIHRGTCTEEAP